MASFLKHFNNTMFETKRDVRNELKKLYIIIEKEMPEQKVRIVLRNQIRKQFLSFTSKESAKLTKIDVSGDENWIHFENDTEFAVEQIRKEGPHEIPHKTTNEKIETVSKK